MAAGFEQTGERPVFHGAVIDVVVGEFSTPDGDRFERDIVRHPGAVAVVPVAAEEVILVRQYRAAVDREVLEIPAGKRDIDGEDPAETARRELVEEVGRSPGRLEPLGEFYNSIGFCDEYTYVFLATELTEAEPAADGVEERYMSVERLPIDGILDAIADRRIVDAKTIIGLTLALAHLR